MVAPTDFKKIKAKVGKRAPVKANVTDTSFSSTKLHVAHQTNAIGDTHKLDATSAATANWSTHQLAQWQRQLQHPTISVRTAAIQGLRHWVRKFTSVTAASAAAAVQVQTNKLDNSFGTQSTTPVTKITYTTKNVVPVPSVSSFSTTTTMGLENFCSAGAPPLLLALAPVVCTDSDAAVRRLATTALIELVAVATTTTKPNTTTSPTTTKGGGGVLWIKPFVPYLTALIATTLNSLDAVQCLDGAVLARWLVQELSPSTMTILERNKTLEVEEGIWKSCLGQFVPPLTRLLSDRNGGRLASAGFASSPLLLNTEVGSINKSNTKSSKKRKRSQASSNNNGKSSSSNNPQPVASGEKTRAAAAANPRQTVLSAIHAIFLAASNQNDDSTFFRSARSATESSPDGVVAAGGEGRIARPDLIVRGGGRHQNPSRPALICTNNTSLTTQQSTIRGRYSLYSFNNFPSYRQLGIISELSTTEEEENDDATEMRPGGQGSLFGSVSMQAPSSKRRHLEDGPLSLAVVLELLTKLRDCLVEATMQYKQCQNQSSHTLVMCATTIRLALQSRFTSHTLSCAINDPSSPDDAHKRLQKLCGQFSLSIKESFPLPMPQQSGAVADNTLTQEDRNASNAQLCQTLLCVTSVLRACSTVRADSTTSAVTKNIQSNVQSVALYVQSALEDDEAAAAIHDKGSDQAANVEGEPELLPLMPQLVLSTSKSLLGVLAQLVQLLHPALVESNNCMPLTKLNADGELRVTLLELFCTVFFSTDKKIPVEIACSETGRFAALWGCTLLVDNFDSRGQIDKRNSEASLDCSSFQKSFVIDILYGLPIYLCHWRAEYVNDSKVCLSVLQTFVRKYHRSPLQNPNEAIRQQDLSLICTSLEPLLQLTRAPSSQPSTKETHNYDRITAFEQFPEDIQRSMVCLFTNVMTPTANVIRSFADICARYRALDKMKPATNLCTSVAAFIVQCVQSIRKTMDMSLFVGFLIDSSGIMSLDRVMIPKSPLDFAWKTDQGLRDSSFYLVQCGTAKVLPMLEGLITVLLNKCVSESRSHSNSLIQARAGLALLAVFSSYQHEHEKKDASIFDHVSDRFHATVKKRLAWMLSNGILDMEFETSASCLRWIQPFTALFATEKGLMVEVCGSIARDLPSLTETNQAQILEVWLAMINCASCDLPPRQDSGEFIAILKSLETNSSSDGLTQQLICRLLLAATMASGNHDR